MVKQILFSIGIATQFSLVSAKELKNEFHLINSEKSINNSVHQKLPKTVTIKTKKFKIKIDLQANGTYRYQSWASNAKSNAKPNLIIYNGELIPDGSGGNYYYEFKNKDYTYQVWRNYLTDSASKAPYTLVVNDKNGNEVVNEDGQVLKR
ncbi:hypothetical protein M2347_004122 [Chryseobacterium sp. H1D6B]|uniref:hypothetical protein n=1 Tax=Chryseobacterium sp. H1D6B TaxID=2940588 RepID=UPI0015C99096|nr:hypothetical protein [Chryseobacterium sp. H1D6B]MDH6254395.1 hypothetical protein [Chryseobacterium sp. H1D6B]